MAEIQEGTTVVRYLNSLTTDERFLRQAATTEYYHVDALGSTLALTDVDGTVATSYSYEPYGKSTITGTTANTFTYTGREYEEENGLYFYRARYYDATTGRFLSEDPIGFAGRDQNLYRYVFNNPTNLTDPEGFRAGSGEGFKQLFRALERAARAAVDEFNKATPAREFVEKVLENFLQDQADGDQLKQMNDIMRRIREAREKAEQARKNDSDFDKPCRDGIMCNREELEREFKNKFSCE